MIVQILPKPAKTVVGLAWDGSRLWAGDWESQTLMRLAADGSIEKSFAAPGRLVGLTFAADRLLAVVSTESDDRSIHRFDPAHGAWEDQVIRCPEDTGSQLSWDGARLWVSQRYKKRALRLAPDGSIEQTFELPAEVTGIHWSGHALWTNLRIEKGSSDIARFTGAANSAVLSAPELLERYPQSFASLAYDGSGFWMSDLRGPTIARAVPPGL